VTCELKTSAFTGCQNNASYVAFDPAEPEEATYTCGKHLAQAVDRIIASGAQHVRIMHPGREDDYEHTYQEKA
jgi:hypothetical protein